MTSETTDLLVAGWQFCLGAHSLPARPPSASFPRGQKTHNATEEGELAMPANANARRPFLTSL